jgi:glycyl-tRNA synthetase beta chain
MPDFLLELLSEEIPARMQAKASADLARLFEGALKAAGLSTQGIETYATPRRLALIARGLPAETQAVSEEIKGPRASAPPQALEGFLRKTGLSREQLVERDGIFFAVIDKPGRGTASVLAEAIPQIVRAFPWPKSMRWGAASASTESIRWVRPLQGIVALLGEDIVEFEIAGIRSGAATVGHRFHHPGIITIGGAHDYAEKLRACHVILDPEERQKIIRDGAAALAAGVGVELIEDEGLVAENAGLTEWPLPLIGRFDQAYLDVPPEVIQLTARVNQKYFVCRELDGHLANAFICTANIEASDGGAAIVAGNERVLSARLSDAKFFWEQDLKIPLEDQANKLDQIVFHEKLGTVADKVERVAKLARWLVEEGIVKGPSPLAGEGQAREAGQGEGTGAGQQALTLPPGSAGRAPPSPARGEGLDRAALAETAARLCKADLVTGMVGEFPELQGVIGGYLARAQGHPDAVADAIRDHYKPVGQGDEVPTAPVTVAVSLADKLDTLVGFFAIGDKPSGSKDPYALRRAALGLISIILTNNVRIPLLAASLWRQTHDEGVETFGRQSRLRRPRRIRTIDQLQTQQSKSLSKKLVLDIGLTSLWHGLVTEVDARETLPDFLTDRLKVQQREAGVRHDLIDAVFALGGEDDLVRLLARVKALQAFVETAEGADLLAGYKRAANILKKEGWGSPSPISGEGGARSAQPSGRVREGEDSPSPDGADAPPLSPEMGEGKELSYSPEPEEAALIAALDAAEPRARAAVEAEDFEGAMAALASLRAPVDAFFDKVTVNDADPVKRAARLDLLLRMRDAVHQVADFSRIEG